MPATVSRNPLVSTTHPATRTAAAAPSATTGSKARPARKHAAANPASPRQAPDRRMRRMTAGLTPSVRASTEAATPTATSSYSMTGIAATAGRRYSVSPSRRSRDSAVPSVSSGPPPSRCRTHGCARSSSLATCGSKTGSSPPMVIVAGTARSARFAGPSTVSRHTSVPATLWGRALDIIVICPLLGHYACLDKPDVAPGDQLSPARRGGSAASPRRGTCLPPSGRTAARRGCQAPKACAAGDPSSPAWLPRCCVR